MKAEITQQARAPEILPFRQRHQPTPTATHRPPAEFAQAVERRWQPDGGNLVARSYDAACTLSVQTSRPVAKSSSPVVAWTPISSALHCLRLSGGATSALDQETTCRARRQECASLLKADTFALMSTRSSYERTRRYSAASATPALRCRTSCRSWRLMDEVPRTTSGQGRQRGLLPCTWSPMTVTRSITRSPTKSLTT